MARTGRPPGKTFPVTKLVKLTEEQRAALSAFAANNGISESEAIRQLIAEALEARSKPKPSKKA